jgi:hypothetical protein
MMELRESAGLWRRRVSQGLFVLSALGALVACGGASTAATTTLASRGYLFTTATEAEFIQLTVASTNLSGTLDVVELAGTTTTSQHDSFTGSETGQSVTLTFSQGFGSIVNISGASSNGALVLNFPQSDGSLNSTAFVPSTIAAYNTALVQLQGEAATAQASQAAAVEQAQLDQAVTSAAQKVEADISRLQSDGFGSTSLSADLQSQQSDLATMRADEVTARNETDSAQRCADGTQVVADSTQVQADATQVQSDQSSVESTVQGLQSDINSADTDLAALHQALAQDPAYSGTLPTASDVATAIAPVQQAIKTNVTAANAAVSKANAVSASAEKEATTFQQQMCAGQ